MERPRSKRKVNSQYSNPLTTNKSEVNSSSPKNYKYSYYKHRQNYSVEDKENRFESGTLPKTRAQKSYSEHVYNSKHTRSNAGYVQKYKKASDYYCKKPEGTTQRANKVYYSQDFNNRGQSPVHSSLASKPSK